MTYTSGFQDEVFSLIKGFLEVGEGFELLKWHVVNELLKSLVDLAGHDECLVTVVTDAIQ